MFAGIDVAQDHPSRGWTAIASFTVQAALLGAALVYPILYPQKLSDLAHRRIFVPTSLSEVRTTTTAQSSPQTGGRVFVAPIVVNRDISRRATNEASRDVGIETPPSIPGLGATPDGFLGVFPTDAGHPTLSHPTASAHNMRVSSMMQGMLVRRIEPRYPPSAIAARIEGPVKIKAIISREGIITQAQVLSGSPLLSGAALEAIRQWRYKPYILNGEPFEVETEITVNFILGR